uniref:Uncharacterized protein n=1 Tax=Bionectria ochroleuca TaxID=29856 RepID=A0A0B7KBA7_BIOOC
MLKWLALQAQSFEGSLGFIVMWKWKNMKPIFDWLEAQMQFMLLNILVINSTVELNIMAKFLTTPGNGSPPLCRSRFKTLSRSIKDFERQIKELQEAQKLREGQLSLVTKITSSSQKYMRDSMDMLQTLKKTYTPSAAINIRIPINIISIYKAQELGLSIQDLEPGDPQKVRYISSEHRTSNWKVVGKTLDIKIYSDSSAHTKPKTLSLFVAHASLDPPIILGQPFLKQSKRNYRIQ